MGTDDWRHRGAGAKCLSGRFVKGQSGNPSGRPTKRRPNISAFDIIFDKRLKVTQGGVERELTIDEALELQTYRSALKGGRMAVRAVLKMIEVRESALAEGQAEPAHRAPSLSLQYDAENANEAMRLLGLVSIDPMAVGYFENRPKINTWAAQAALSRPGRRQPKAPREADSNAIVHEPEKLRRPGRRQT
jgi:hypothetical protein